jgi:hypothetical protein
MSAVRHPVLARALRLFLVALVVAGCSGELTAPTEPLRLLAPNLPAAFVGEALDVPLRPTGGLRPYRYAVVDGALPPGVRLQGGRLVGAPTREGRFAFTVEVSDASLSRTIGRYELLVRPLPLPTLLLDAPLTDVQRATTVRLQLADARGWRGARVEIRWEGEAFTLADAGVAPARATLATFWEAGEGWLRIDVAALGPALDGAHELARFTLVPVEPGPLALSVRGEHRYVGGHHFATTTAGAAPPPGPQRTRGQGDRASDEPVDDDPAGEGPGDDEPPLDDELDPDDSGEEGSDP